MAYKLTLTHDERSAIDWVGHRYSNGTDLWRLLWCQSKQPEGAEREWDDADDITFIVPENVAWQIAENASQEDGRWPCFADELADKLQAFVDAIV